MEREKLSSGPPLMCGILNSDVHRRDRACCVRCCCAACASGSLKERVRDTLHVCDLLAGGKPIGSGGQFDRGADRVVGTYRRSYAHYYRSSRSELHECVDTRAEHWTKALSGHISSHWHLSVKIARIRSHKVTVNFFLTVEWRVDDDVGSYSRRRLTALKLVDAQ
jgi:hypothetical protein